MTYLEMTLNQRINYKGFQELKALIFAGWAFATLPFAVALDVSNPHLYNRYLRYLGESRSFHNYRAKYKGRNAAKKYVCSC